MAEDICLVKPPKSRVESPVLRLALRGLEYPRVIPFHAQVDPKQFNDVMGKVRGKQLIELIFTVPTVRLKYKKKEWTEETQFYLQIPFPLAVKLAEKMLRLSKRHIRARPSEKTTEG